MAFPGAAGPSAALRHEMVAGLVATGAVRSEAVREAFERVRREQFVPEVAVRDGVAAVYRPDIALTTATDRWGSSISSSSAPDIMGPMLEALRIEPGQRVLEVGTGTGYNAALLSCLVGEDGQVTTLDIEEAFARRAGEALAAGGFGVRVVVGDGRAGWAPGAPYDRIIVTASADEVPRALRDQVVDGGLVEVPVRPGRDLLPHLIATFRREGERLRSMGVVAGGFMALRPAAGADAADDPPDLRAVSGSRAGTMVLAGLHGAGLSALSMPARRRALSLLLGARRPVGALPVESGLGLISFLTLSDLPELVAVTVHGRSGVALVDRDGRRVTTVTHARGQACRIEAFGEEGRGSPLVDHVAAWEAMGRPSVADLRLAVDYGDAVRGTPWRVIRRGRSLLSVDWSPGA